MPINTGLAPCFGGCQGCHKGVRLLISTHQKRCFQLVEAQHHLSASKTSSSGVQSKLVCTSKHHRKPWKVSSEARQSKLVCWGGLTPLWHPWHPPKQGARPVLIGVSHPYTLKRENSYTANKIPRTKCREHYTVRASPRGGLEGVSKNSEARLSVPVAFQYGT